MNNNSGTQNDMYSKVFPGEKWTITFEPTDEQAAALTSMVAARAISTDDNDMLMQMLGLAPSEAAFNPRARDAWTKKPSRVPAPRPTIETARDGSTHCKRGHVRSEYSFLDPRGSARCRKCHREATKESRKRREKAAA